MLTRKGPIFFESRLDYREVGDTDQALDSLSNCGLITRSAPVPAEWLLNQLTKSDLLALFPVAGGSLRSASKDTLKTRILSRYPDRRICCVVAATQPWCTVGNLCHWRLVQLLYFGSSGKDWSAHIRLDLGHIRYEPVELSKSRFADRVSLLSYLEERELQHRIYRLDEYPQLLPALITAVEKAPNGELTKRLRQRNVLRLGKWCERQQALDDALKVYLNAEIPPARERRVRFCTNKASMKVVGLSWRTSQLNHKAQQS